jgi:heat shock protein HtpX
MGMNNLTNNLKTWTLMAALAGLLVFVGGLIGGQQGLILALVFAVARSCPISPGE